MTTRMTATIVPLEVLDAKRRAREKQRKEREAFMGSILTALDDDDDQQRAPASPARDMEPHR